MLFTSITLLPLAGLALAAPARDAAAMVPRAALGEIQPNTVIRHTLYDNSPNWCYPNDTVHIWRTGPWPDKGASAIYSFTYPGGLSGKQCWLDFTNAPPTQLSNPGGVQIDVFSSTSASSCSGGSQANNRGNNWGRWNVPISGQAPWIQTYGGLSKKSPCKNAGEQEWIELVAAGDSTSLQYKQKAGQGVRILWE